MIIDLLQASKIFANEVMVQYFICFRKMTVGWILLCYLDMFRWVVFRSAVISLMKWVFHHHGADKFLVLLLGSLPARDAFCFGRAGGLPCWAGAHQLLKPQWLSRGAFTLTVMRHADLYGSNQATSVVSLMTFKTESRKKCKRPGFLQTGLFRRLR